MVDKKPNTKQKLGDWVYDTSVVLGQGVFGKVYEGFNVKDKQAKVAVKVQNLDDLQNLSPDKWQEIIKRETQIVKNIKNKNIVENYDFKMTQKPYCLYIFMEKCDKDNLKTKIQQGQIEESVAKKILIDILEGYKAINQIKAIHRDLKPENILFKDGCAKIADFGLSKISDPTSSTQQLTVQGTPQYRCPEFLTQSTYIDIKYPDKVDIWSIGILFYEMLFGQVPWKMTTIADYIEIIETSELQFPSTPKISEEAKSLIKGMLLYNEEERLGFKQVLEHPYINI